MLDRAGETGKDGILEMTLTIYEGYNKRVVYVVTADDRFSEFYLTSKRGREYFVEVDCKNIYKELEEIASFVNNELGEECMFAIG